MIDTGTALAVGTVLWGAVTWIAFRLRKPRSLNEQVPEPTCAGYEFREYGESKQRKDCEANRSPTCSDGRCSYHCRKMCRCDATRSEEKIP